MDEAPKFYRRKSFWIAVVLAATLIASAAGVSIPPPIVAGAQALIGVVLGGDAAPDAEDDVAQPPPAVRANEPGDGATQPRAAAPHVDQGAPAPGESAQ